MGLFTELMSSRVQNSSQEELLWHRVFPDEDMRSAAGIRITERNALTVTDVFKCVRTRAESFAILPKKLYKRDTVLRRQSRKEAQRHPLYRIVHDQPNPTISSYRFFELLSTHRDTWGNFYAYIERGSQTGRPANLWQLQPHTVRPCYENGQLWYYVLNMTTNTEVKFYPDEILHVPGLGYDGVMGYSPVRLMMDALGWAKATERYSARFFANSARPSGIVSTEGALTPEQKKNLKESFAAFHTGVDNAAKVALIEGSVKWQPLTIPQNEAQFLETRKLQRTDVAGMYRVPPFMIGDNDPVSDNNVEHMGIQFATWAVQPSCECTEQEFERQLLLESEKKDFFFEWELKALMKGDTAARTAHYKDMVNIGVMSQNDVLDEENQSPFEGGDTHWMQLNMAPIDQLLKMATDAQQEPDPQQALQNSVLDELQTRFRAAYKAPFADVIGRIVGKKPDVREQVTPGIAAYLLAGLAEGLSVSPGVGFLNGYLAEMGKRSVDWKADQINEIAVVEVDRAVKALVEGSPSEQVPA